MDTKLFTYIDVSQIQNHLQDELSKHHDNSKRDKRLDIDFTIYENDKKDPGKKTEASKKYAGYLILGLKYDSVLIYKIQTDFNNHKGKDIPKRIECMVKSIMSL